MLITRTSPFTGVQNSIEIPGLTEAMLKAWQEGSLIQDAMPSISPEHREFLMTGITPAEWDALFEDRR